PRDELPAPFVRKFRRWPRATNSLRTRARSVRSPRSSASFRHRILREIQHRSFRALLPPPPRSEFLERRRKTPLFPSDRGRPIQGWQRLAQSSSRYCCRNRIQRLQFRRQSHQAEAAPPRHESAPCNPHRDQCWASGLIGSDQNGFGFRHRPKFSERNMSWQMIEATRAGYDGLLRFQPTMCCDPVGDQLATFDVRGLHIDGAYAELFVAEQTLIVGSHIMFDEIEIAINL